MTGSPYFGGGSSGGGSSYFGGSGGGKAPAKKAGGVLGAIEGAGHYFAKKTELAGRDIKSIPGGLIHQLGVTGNDIVALAEGAPMSDPRRQAANNLGKSIVKSGVESVKHPARDPFQTLLNVAMLGHAGASGVARGAEVARTGELSAAVRDLPVKPRLLRVNDEPVPLHPSRSPLVRAGQAVHDKVVQHAIDTKPEGKLAAYGTKRAGGSLDETARYQQRQREAPANALEGVAKKLTSRTQRGAGRIHQAALELTSVNTSPEDAAAYHLGRAADGVEPRQNLAVAKLYQAVAKQGLLTKNEHGDVIVSDAHPKLAQADLHLAKVQGRGDEILARYGVRSPEELQARVNAPGRLRAGATYEKPTPGKAGKSAALDTAVAERDRLAAIHEKALSQEANWHAATQGGNVTKDLRSPMTQSDALAKLAVLDKQHEALLQKIVPEINQSDDAKAMAAETRARNMSRGKIRKGRAEERTNSGSAHMRTVKQELRDAAEAKLTEFLASHPDHPVSVAHAARLAERESLRNVLNQRGEASIEGTRPETLPKTGEQPTVPPASNPYRNRIVQVGTRLEAAQAKVDRLQAAAEKRVKPTGIVGGETARKGRGFISYATDEKRASSSPATASPGAVVGEVRSPITNKTLTGAGIAKGLVPKDITGHAARHFRQIVRFVNTTERRNAAIRAGSDTRRSSRDVLVRVPGEEHAKIPRIVEQTLGKKRPTTDDVAGITAALDEYRQGLVPGLRDRFASDNQHPIGASAADAAAEQGLEAPEGYKWVDKNLLGSLAKAPIGPRGRVARTADSLNSAVTAATVYFKIGHIGTRALTNTATNMIQGSLNRGDLSHAFELWKALAPEDRQRALAASGQHGYQAMPHEGQNLVGRVASKGANWWAKHVDSPFRFNSIAHEAKRAGFDTPEKFRYMLSKLEDGGKGLAPEEWAKIDRVAKEANRAGIAYDRLSETERRFITRGLWFYPWVAGASRFAVHTVLEHPYKATLFTNAGAQGRERQVRELGDVPSYEAGLFKIGKVDRTGRPLVADFSTFSPFATPADVLNAVARPAELSGFLNPVYGSVDQLINGQNQFGSKSQHPVTDALASLFSPTPEAQIVTALMHRRQDQSNRMFRTTPGSALKRALIGPGLPRRINLSAAHKSAGRETSGR